MSRGPAARRAIALLAERQPFLSGRFGDLGLLLEGLGELGERRFAVLSAMLELGNADALLRRALLQATIPGLPGIGERIGWGAPSFSRSECMAELVAITWELTGRWAGQRRAYCVPDLLSATRLAAMRRVRRMRPIATGLDLDLVSSADATSELDGALDLNAQLAALPERPRAALFAQAVLGMGVSETAQQLGVSARTVQRWNANLATGLRRPVAVA